MKRKIHFGISILIIFLGSIHIYLSTCYEVFDHDTLWFIGAGVAIILSGFINLMYLKGTSVFNHRVCLITNSIFLILFGVSLILIPDMQVYLGIALYAIAIILSLRRAE